MITTTKIILCSHNFTWTALKLQTSISNECIIWDELKVVCSVATPYFFKSIVLFLAFLKMYFYLTKYARKILFWNNLYFLCTFKIRSVWNAESDLVKLVTFKTVFSFDFLIFLLMVFTQQKYRNFTHHNLKSASTRSTPMPSTWNAFTHHNVQNISKVPSCYYFAHLFIWHWDYKMKWLHKFDWSAIFFEKSAVTKLGI